MEREVLRDLGDGLVLRRGTSDDAEAVADFNATMHGSPGEPDEGIRVWTRELMRGDHPTCGPGDFTVVQDTRSGAVVSTLCLISQTWSYGGVPLAVGRPELVGTHPDYRRRGLVRRQLEVVHKWSAEWGELLQGITGIRWYYRQFGYELGGLALGGARTGYPPHVPKLEEGADEPYRVRPATDADLPLVARLYARGAGWQMVACVRDEALWRYELHRREREDVGGNKVCVIEAAGGAPTGALIHSSGLVDGAVGAYLYELEPHASWLEVTPSVIRYLAATGRALASRTGKEFAAFSFELGTEHPVYDVFADRLPGKGAPYAWYLRVPDLPRFLRHVAPVLEGRLASSVLEGYTGELKLNFYRDGVRLVFERGRLAAVEPWAHTQGRTSTAAFPGLTFLQLLFGYRTLEELRHAFADCWASGDGASVLLSTLFPKQASNVWALS